MRVPRRCDPIGVGKIRARRSERACVAIDDGHEHQDGPTSPQEARETRERCIVEPEDATCERAPREGDLNRVDAPDELNGRSLDSSPDEAQVGNATAIGGSSGPHRHFGHRRGVRVDSQDKRVRPALGEPTCRAAVTRAEIEDEPPVRAGQMIELADVHLEAAAADYEIRGSSPFCSDTSYSAARAPQKGRRGRRRTRRARWRPVRTEAPTAVLLTRGA